MEEITIQGKKYPFAINMQTFINYESMIGNNFFTENFDTIIKRMAIILAAVQEADPDTELTVETLKGEGKLEDVLALIAAYTTVMDAIEVFFKIPEIEKKKQEQEAKKGEDDPKNA